VSLADVLTAVSLAHLPDGYTLGVVHDSYEDATIFDPTIGSTDAQALTSEVHAVVNDTRRAREGGSWHVQVSLVQTGRWLREMGRVRDGFASVDPTLADVADFLEESPSGWGRLRAVSHAARMSETPPRWELPAMPLGTHPPTWQGDM
jgi:hypothetical protein